MAAWGGWGGDAEAGLRWVYACALGLAGEGAESGEEGRTDQVRLEDHGARRGSVQPRPSYGGETEAPGASDVRVGAQMAYTCMDASGTVWKVGLTVALGASLQA